MTLKDVRLINRTNKIAVFIGVVLVFVGSVVSAYSGHGWLLGALFGVIAVLVSLRFQQSRLLKIFEQKVSDELILKDEVSVIKKSQAEGPDISQEKR